MANDQTNVELSDLIRTIVRETVAELVSTGTITTTKPPLAETAQLLTAKETAKRLSISERHLYTLTRSGELRVFTLGKRAADFRMEQAVPKKPRHCGVASIVAPVLSRCTELRSCQTPLGPRNERSSTNRPLKRRLQFELRSDSTLPGSHSQEKSLAVVG